MNDYDYDDLPMYGDSDEDTEDASETESMKYQNDEYGYDGATDDFDSKYEIKEQIYQDKLAQLKNQLIHLEKGIHPEYVHRLDILEQEYNERLFFIECNFESGLALVENDYKLEEKAAIKEFEERKAELKESLKADLREKKKLMETDSSFELINDTSEPKILTTRKLRRRPNDPTPLPDRRRRTSPAQINYLLGDTDINNDLKDINKFLL